VGSLAYKEVFGGRGINIVTAFGKILKGRKDYTAQSRRIYLAF
jgi:hypothetical protein